MSAIITTTSTTGSSNEYTIYHSHLVNATRVFWWSLFWTIIGAILIPVAIGFAVWAVAWLWVLYRLVDGLAKILSDVPYPV